MRLPYVSLPVDVAYPVGGRAEFIIATPLSEYRYDFRALVAAVVDLFRFFTPGLIGVSYVESMSYPSIRTTSVCIVITHEN